MMQLVTQNKKLKPNSPWRALEVLLFDSSRLWVEARNCFLVKMSKDRKMQVNEMEAIMKCKQEVSQDRYVKQWKTIRKPIANISNLFRGSSHRSTSPPLPPWRVSTISTEEITRGLPKTGVPNSHQSNPLHKRDLNTKVEQVTRWSTRTTHFSLTTPYRMRKNFGSRSIVRKFSWKESKRAWNPLKNSNHECT